MALIWGHKLYRNGVLASSSSPPRPRLRASIAAPSTNFGKIGVRQAVFFLSGHVRTPPKDERGPEHESLMPTNTKVLS
jgi:hypothetical protein